MVNLNMAKNDSPDNASTIRALIQLARPFKARFVLIAVVALLATAADLTQPLIYRVAINDVAGLFVEHPPQSGNVEKAAPVAPRRKATAEKVERKEREPERAAKPRLRHRPGFV